MGTIRLVYVHNAGVGCQIIVLIRSVGPVLIHSLGAVQHLVNHAINLPFYVKYVRLRRHVRRIAGSIKPHCEDCS